MRRWSLVFGRWLVVLASCVLGWADSDKSAQPEIRALWVDGFHAGIRTKAEADQLVADAGRAHINMLMVQVRRRGDAYYLQSLEPYVEDAPFDPAFDPLQYVIEAAHRAGIQVHAWINAAPLWRDQAPPHDPRHIYNQYGPGQSGEQNWLTAQHDGNVKFPVGYFLDIGHPAAADHIANVYLNVVRNYQVDGIHFDYIRYPETDGTQLPRGADVGYNATSLARFRHATGRTDTPEPGDEQWIAWRRQQVSQLVRRVYLEAKTINPHLIVSAAVIAWGRPPVSEADFANVAPMQRIFQDWHSWLQQGLLDAAFPMNYAAESNAQVKQWFDGWIAWEKEHKHDRLLAVGVGAYRNTPEQVLAQIGRVRTPVHRARADGVSLYSYSSPSSEAQPQVASVESAAPADRMAFLTKEAFATAVTTPRMPWIQQPKRGYITGRLLAGDVDGARVSIRKTHWFARTQNIIADGNGYFGFAELKPGKYRVAAASRSATVEIVAGRATRADLK